MFWIGIALAVLFFAFVVWIIHEANIGRDNILFQTVRATPYGDKIGHFLLAGLLTLVANLLLRNRCLRVAKLAIPYGSLVVFVLVAFEEGSQHYMPTRSLDIKDALANLAGIVLFSIPPFLFKKKGGRESAADHE